MISSLEALSRKERFLRFLKENELQLTANIKKFIIEHLENLKNYCFSIFPLLIMTLIEYKILL